VRISSPIISHKTRFPSLPAYGWGVTFRLYRHCARPDLNGRHWPYSPVAGTVPETSDDSALPDSSALDHSATSTPPSLRPPSSESTPVWSATIKDRLIVPSQD